MNTYVLAALAVVLVSGMISLCEGKCGKTKISESVSFCASRNRLILLFLIRIYISVKTKFHIYAIFLTIDYFFSVDLQEMQPGIRIIMVTCVRPPEGPFPDQQPVARCIEGIQTRTALLHADTTLNPHRDAKETITWNESLPQPPPSLSPPPPRRPPVDP